MGAKDLLRDRLGADTAGMKQIIEAAFLPPPGAEKTHGFAVLPQQSEGELQLSAAHTRLDRVLNFLIRELGYTFLDDAKPSRGGGVTLKAHSRECPPLRVGHKSSRFPSKDPQVDDEETAVIRIGPEASKYAQYPEDLLLVRRFTGILIETTPAAAAKVTTDTFYKVVLQGVRLMHLCSYEYSDVVLVLAYATIYFQSTFTAIGQMMSDIEAAHVCTLLIYLAHSFVLDETCPLRCWRKHIFRKYCTLKVLDAALFRLFDLRGFRLRVSSEEERDALSALLHSPSPKGVMDVGNVVIGQAASRLKHQGSESKQAGSPKSGSPKSASPKSGISNANGRSVPQDAGKGGYPHNDGGAHKRRTKERPRRNGVGTHGTPPLDCDCDRSVSGGGGTAAMLPGAGASCVELKLSPCQAGA
mmetsp:Transcript_100936/g.291952  ORF Transcript_100936/g.291952 Transcript_100936/m.291952 type:complete len:414 (+) Transcript_100936:168-1409(+)